MTRPAGRNTFESANTIHNIGRILKLLETGPKTYAQVCEALHYFAHLRAMPNKRIYLKGHLPISNGYVSLFALGSKPDAVKRVQTEQERNAKYRAKVKASPERTERRRLRNSAAWAIKKAKRKPNTWLSALGVQP